MYDLKKSLVVFVGLCLLVLAFASLLPLRSKGQGNGANLTPYFPRKFYLTKTGHKGDTALSACESRYHMASLWEISDPSNVRYNTELGVTTADSGFGPPFAGGWIRTGFGSDSGDAGQANCQAWTTGDDTSRGTFVALPSMWNLPNMNRVSPWQAFTFTCNTELPVWCVQD